MFYCNCTFMVLTIRVGFLFRFENRISRLFCRDSNLTILVSGPCLQGLCFHRCLSVHRGSVCQPPGQIPPPPGRHPPGQCMLGHGQQAGGMHPTGMHSSFFCILAFFFLVLWSVQ